MHGLSEADDCFRIRLRESCNYQMPQSLCRFFSTILVDCNPLNGRLLWEEFAGPLSEDYARLNDANPIMAMNMALVDIGHQLDSMGKSIDDYYLVYHKQQAPALMPAISLSSIESAADTTNLVLLEGMASASENNNRGKS